VDDEHRMILIQHLDIPGLRPCPPLALKALRGTGYMQIEDY
jgi:hypothetical protein